LQADNFTLTNKPVHVRATFDNVSGQQRRMFMGMDCLPGQMDLFETDGEPEKHDGDESLNHGRVQGAERD